MKMLKISCLIVLLLSHFSRLVAMEDSFFPNSNSSEHCKGEKVILLQSNDSNELNSIKVDKTQLEGIKSVSGLIKTLSEETKGGVVIEGSGVIPLDVSTTTLNILAKCAKEKDFKYTVDLSALNKDGLVKLFGELDYLEADGIKQFVLNNIISKVDQDFDELDWKQSSEVLSAIRLPLLKSFLSQYFKRLSGYVASFNTTYADSIEKFKTTTFLPLVKPKSTSFGSYTVFHKNTGKSIGWYHFNTKTGVCSYVAPSDRDENHFIFAKSGNFFLVHLNGFIEIRNGNNELLSSIKLIDDQGLEYFFGISNNDQYIMVYSRSISDNNVQKCLVYSNTGQLVKELSGLSIEGELTDSMYMLSSNHLVMLGKASFEKDLVPVIRLYDLKEGGVIDLQSNESDELSGAYIVGSHALDYSIIWCPKKGIAKIISKSGLVADIKMGDDDLVDTIFLTPNQKNIVSVSNKVREAKVYELSGRCINTIELAKSSEYRGVIKYSDTHMIISKDFDLDLYNLDTGHIVTIPNCDKCVNNRFATIIAAFRNPLAVSTIKGSPDKKQITLCNVQDGKLKAISQDVGGKIVFLDDEILCVFGHGSMKIMKTNGEVLLLRGLNGEVKHIDYQEGVLLVVCAIKGKASSELDTIMAFDFSSYFNLKENCLSESDYQNKKTVIQKVLLLRHCLRKMNFEWVNKKSSGLFDSLEQKALSRYQENLYPTTKKYDNENEDEPLAFRPVSRKALIFDSSDEESD